MLFDEIKNSKEFFNIQLLIAIGIFVTIKMFTVCVNTIETALKKSVPKKVFLRNDKSDLTIHRKWITKKTGEFYREKNKRRKHR